MRYAQILTTLVLAGALTASACNQSRTADEPEARTAAAGEQQRQQQETSELEQRVAELDREWNEMQAELAENTAAPTAALKAEVQEDLQNVREAVADLKTTNAENWWERHERRMDQTAADVEEDVRRFARRWTPAAEPEREVGTTGDATGWEARRDRLVERLDARIEAMERALEDIDLRGAQETEVEDTRARVRKMREDTDRLRTATEADWWEITKDRVNDYIERVDRSIDRLDNDRNTNRTDRG